MTTEGLALIMTPAFFFKPASHEDFDKIKKFSDLMQLLITNPEQIGNVYLSGGKQAKSDQLLPYYPQSLNRITVDLYHSLLFGNHRGRGHLLRVWIQGGVNFCHYCSIFLAVSPYDLHLSCRFTFTSCSVQWQKSERIIQFSFLDRELMSGEIFVLQKLIHVRYPKSV